MKKILIIFILLNSFIFADDAEKMLKEQIMVLYNAGDVETLKVKADEYLLKNKGSYFSPYIYYYIGKIYYNKKDYGKSVGYLKETLYNYKLGGEETEDMLLMLYKAGRQYSDYSDMTYFLQRLIAVDRIKYGIIEGQFIYDNISKSDGINIMIESFENNHDKDTAKVLADYYRERNFKKAAMLYKLSESAQDKSNETVVKKNDGNKFEENEAARKYYEAAEKGMEESKYDIAGFYYNKIINEIKDKELKSEAYFYLGRIAYIQKKYKESLDFYNKFLETGNILKNGEAYYNLANIYLLQDDKETTMTYINKIFEEYPFTFWETKAKIMYSLKLKK